MEKYYFSILWSFFPYAKKEYLIILVFRFFKIQSNLDMNLIPILLHLYLLHSYCYISGVKYFRVHSLFYAATTFFEMANFILRDFIILIRGVHQLRFLSLLLAISILLPRKRLHPLLHGLFPVVSNWTILLKKWR